VNSLRPNAEEWHDHKLKVVIGSYIYTVAWRPGMFTWTSRLCATGIDRFTLYGRDERTCIGAYGNIKEQIFRIRNRFGTCVPQEETQYHAGGFIFNRWNTGGIDFVVRVADSSRAIGRVVRAC
jgi:hypothetical protein